jgi:hypothetical protein
MPLLSLGSLAPAPNKVCNVLNDGDVTIDSGKLPAATAEIAMFPPPPPQHCDTYSPFYSIITFIVP